MEKRLFLAIGLSFLVIFLSSKFIKQPVTEEVKGGAVVSEVKSGAGKETVITRTIVPEVPVESEYVFKNSRYTIHFSQPQAAIVAVEFPNFQNYHFSLGSGLYWAAENMQFSLARAQGDTVVYRAETEQRIVTKTYDFSKDNYTIGLRIDIKNKTNQSVILEVPFVLGQLDFTPDKDDPAANTIKDFTVSSKDGISYPDAKKDSIVSGIKFVALRDRYFSVIVQPSEAIFDAQIVKLDQQRSELTLIAKKLQLDAGKDVTLNFSMYIGPQDVAILRKINSDWQAVVYFGKLDFIAHLLLSLLTLLYGMVHNWGWAIILFSLVIYLVLFPLSLKQFKSMREMQAIQPILEQLRVKYKDDQQRFAREQLALFKEHKINPLGGCLPLLLQIPIFITLYQVLTRTVSLKGAGFLWIKDLSLPDRLFIMPMSLPLIGNEINVLPAFMSIGMVLQQKFTTIPQSGEAAQQQKIMMIVMPIMMFFLFYRIPAGVNLYWVVNSILMMVFQMQLMRKK